MRGSILVSTRDFTGGLNLRESAWDISDRESPAENDLRPFGERGSVGQRDGDATSRVWTAPVGDFAARGMLPFPSTPYILIPTITGGLIYVRPDGLAVPGTIQAAPGSLLGEVAMAIAPAGGGQGPLYYTVPDGSRTPRYWDGFTAGNWTASAGAVPPANHLLYHGNRMWAADENSSVYWSKLGDPRDWPAANVNIFGNGDGELIQRIGRLGQYIVVFKSSHCWLIYDLDTGANHPIGPYGSTTTPTVETPYGLAFEDPARGICITDGTNVSQIARALVPANMTAYDMAFFDESLWVSADLQPFGRGIYEYRFPDKTWWRHTAPDAMGLLSVAGDSAFPALSGGGLLMNRSTQRALYEMLVPGALLDSSGASLTPKWKTRFFTLGESQALKRLRQVDFAGEGTITVTGRKDHETASTFTKGPYTLPTANESNRQRIPDLGAAHALQLEMVGGIGGGMRLDELAVRGIVRRD